MAILTQLGSMRDQSLITPEEYEAKRAEVIARISSAFSYGAPIKVSSLAAAA